MKGKEEINKYKSVKCVFCTTGYKSLDLNPGKTHSIETEIGARRGLNILGKVVEKAELRGPGLPPAK